MTEPTTDPRGSIEVDPDPADVVDTPQWPSLPVVPPLSGIPRDSAVEAERVALDLLGAVVGYRGGIRDVLAADAITTAGPVEDTAELRRRVASVSDLLVRRALSPAGVLAAQHAARLAERVAGLTLRGTPPALVSRPRDVFGSAADTVREMGAPDDDAWNAAVGLGVNAGDLSFPALSKILARDDLSAAEQEQRALMARLAGADHTVEQIAEVLDLAPERVRELAARYDLAVQSAVPAERFEVVDTVATIECIIADTAAAGRESQRIDPAEIARMSPAQCADWSRELWLSAKFVLQLRARLDARASGR